MIKIALSGNIASGKSLAKDFLINQGYTVFDADLCAHNLLENSKEILKYFGTNSREELAKTVFCDKNKLKKLEEIIHPQVKKELLNFFEENKNQKLVFAEIPLLFEANFNTFFDKIIFIYAPDEIRLKRLIERNNYDTEYANLRIKSQMSQEEKIKKSDYVILNDSTAENFEIKLKEIIKSLELL